MLEFSEIHPKISRNMSEERRRRWLCFGISVVVHVVFLSVIFLLISPVKVYIPNRNVRKVFIAPAEKLFFHEGGVNTIPSQPVLREASVRGGTSAAEEGTVPGEIVSSQPAVTGGTEEGLVDPVWSSQFQLSLPALGEKRPVREQNLKLELELVPRDTPMDRLLQRTGRYREQKRVDFSKYRPSTYTPAISGIGSRNRPGGTVTASPGPGISLREINYDLSPWADKVLAKIQKTWLVSSEQLSQAIGKVEVLVMVNKSGAVESVKIVQASHASFLDETVLKALELGSPLPNLPYNFPEERLEIRLVFLTR